MDILNKNLSDPFWVNDPRILINSDRLTEIYPSIDMSINERVNAVTRFVLLCGITIVFVKRQGFNPLIISIIIVSGLATLYYPKSDKTMLDIYFKEKELSCKLPTVENPYMNVLPGDDFKNEKPACEFQGKNIEKIMKNVYGSQEDIYNKMHSERQFYTMSNNVISSEGRESFAKAMYGEVTSNKCKNGVIEDCTGNENYIGGNGDYSS